jgi:hypothetical protein
MLPNRQEECQSLRALESRLPRRSLFVEQGRAALKDADRGLELTLSQHTSERRLKGSQTLIDAAYEAKYSNATDAFAIPIMQGEVPKAASVRISLR